MRALRFVLTSAFYGLAEISARLIQFAALFFLARICTKDEYGQIGLLFTLQQIVTILALGGMTEAMTGMLNEYRSRKQLPDLFSNVSKLMGVFAGLISLFYIIASVTIFQRHLANEPAGLYLSVLLCGLLLAYFRMSVSIHQLQEKHRRAVLLKTMPILFCYVFGLLGAIYTKGIFGFFAGCAMGLIIFVLMEKMSDNNQPKNKNALDLNLVKSLFKDSLPFLAVGIMGWLSGYGNNFFIKGFFSNIEVAEFTMVFNFNFVLLLVINSINQVWAPRFYKIASECSEEYLNKVNTLVNQGQFLAISVLSGMILLYFQEGISIAGGNLAGYRSVHPYLVITCSSCVFLNLYYRSSSYFLLHREGRLFMKIVLWTSLIGTGIWVFLMWKIGVWGIYLGFFLVMVMRGGVIFYHASKKWRVKMSFFDIPLGLSIVGCGYGLSVAEHNLFLRTAYYIFAVSAMALVFYWCNRAKIKEYIGF